jgi:hypothetical protein
VKYKIFTPDEANATLEEVIRPALERIQRNLDDLGRVERESRIMSLIVDSGASDTNPDRARYAQLLNRLEMIKGEVRGDIDSIRGTGALVKDLRQGLVDFFAYQEGRLVFLCWRRGEDRIRFWHPIDEGFPGRRPLDQRAELED